MVRCKKKEKKDFEAWLLNFEKITGKPVVVSLLIEDGDIEFLSTHNKRLYEALHEELDEDEPDTKLCELKDKMLNSHELSHNYIG